MKLKENVKQEIIEIVATSFETGHFSDFDQLEMSVVLVQEYPKASKEELWKLLAAAKEYYDELVNLGPVGFYEEFKDSYDFDPMFIQEYGDSDAEEEIEIDSMYHDCDEEELRRMGCFGDEEEDYE